MDYFSYIIAAVLGAGFGSFINAAVYRVHEKKSLVKNRSECVNCYSVIAWYDLFPAISFIILGGKCRKCKGPIPWHYFVVEIITSLLFVYAVFKTGFSLLNPEWSLLPMLIRDFVGIMVMEFLFIYDWKYYILPDVVTIPAIFLFFLFSLILGVNVINLLLAVAIGGGFFMVQFLVSKGRWIGGGDIRFGALMGALLGWPLVLVGLFISYLMGALVGIVLIITKNKKMTSKVPFGTFLAVGTLVTLWFGSAMLGWYLSLSGLV